MSSGARVAPLNPALTSTELATRLSQLSARAVLVPRHLTNKLEFANSVAESTSFWIMDIEGSGGSSEVRIVSKLERLLTSGALVRVIAELAVIHRPQDNSR